MKDNSPKLTRKPQPRLLNPPRCDNCGCPDDLFFYEFVKKGITLCEWCADKRVEAVSKKRNPPIWPLIDGAYKIPELSEKYRSDE